MKKRFFVPLLSCTLMLTALTACGSPAHTHSAEIWSADLENHWKLCECGETFDTGAHTTENDICTVCSSEIMIFEDGDAFLQTYNEHGDPLLYVSYAADGSVGSEEHREYVYDADGNKLSIFSTEYDGSGNLTAEHEFAPNDAGGFQNIKDTYYYEDGTKEVTEYDTNWNLIFSAYYDADGSVLHSTSYEYNEEYTWMSETFYSGEMLAAERTYSIDADGVTELLTEKTYNEDGSWIGMEYDLYGNQVIEIQSDAEGNVELDRRYEHTYDAEGNRTLTKTYNNGVLVEEVEYLFGSDDNGSWSMSGKTTVYHEDGTKTVSDSDSEATWSTEITYDADGNVLEEIRYEYDKNEDGDSTGSRGYKNGKLFVETKVITGSDGETTGIHWIDYHDDGTKTVTEYDDMFELISKTVYDAAGNVISNP